MIFNVQPLSSAPELQAITQAVTALETVISDGLTTFQIPFTGDTLQAGGRYLVDTDMVSSLVLPTNPQAGEFVAIVSKGTTGTCILDVGANSLNGAAADGLLLPNQTNYLIWDGSEWIAPLLGNTIAFNKPVYHGVNTAGWSTTPQLLYRATDGNPFTANDEGIQSSGRLGWIYCDLGFSHSGVLRVRMIYAKDSSPGLPGEWGLVAGNTPGTWSYLVPQTLSPSSVRQSLVLESPFTGRYVGAYCKDLGTGRVVLAVQEIEVW